MEHAGRSAAPAPWELAGAVPMEVSEGRVGQRPHLTIPGGSFPVPPMPRRTFLTRRLGLAICNLGLALVRRADRGYRREVGR